MKKLAINIALIIAIIITASSCSKSCHWVKGKGPDVKNTRNAGEFKEVSVSLDANVELYQDSIYSIEMIGQQNVLDVITTSSNGTTLSIDVKKHVTLRHHNDITIRIHMPSLTGLDISGSGKISTMQQGFSMVNMRTNVSGSGDIFLNGAITGTLNANISGSGNVNFSGTSNCSSAQYTISGSGNMNSEWLKADVVDAKISGSGEAKLYAVKQLNANISGSGNIKYRGTPEINVKISGSGKLKSIN